MIRPNPFIMIAMITEKLGGTESRPAGAELEAKAWSFLSGLEETVFVGTPPRKRVELPRLMQEHRGYCGQTEVGGNCETGHQGSWAGVATMQDCVGRCHACARCQYISFSKKFDDCSWYAACDAMLTEIPNQPPRAGEAFRTIRVKAAVASNRGHSGCRQQLLVVPSTQKRHNGGCAMTTVAGAPAVVITSTSTSSWRSAERRGFEGTVLERALGVNLWVYHEHAFDALKGRADDKVPQAPVGRVDVCMVNLFGVTPGLDEVVSSPESCIDTFYRIGGVREPFEFMLRVQTGKLWVRNVAAIAHALASLPRGASLLWLDFDAVALRPLDAQFWQFCRAHDVSYLPFVDVTHVPSWVSMTQT